MTTRPPRLPVRVCSIHGLAPGPDGRCVLCQRSASPAEGSQSLRAVGAIAAACAIVLGGAMLWKRSERHTTTDPEGDLRPVIAPAPSAAPPEDPREKSLVQDAEEARQARLEKQGLAEQDRKRRVEAEVRNVRIVMFTTKPCEMCDLAREWLGKEHLAFREIDVGSDPSALADMHKLTPGNEVPVFDVDGEVLVGFGPTNVAGAVHRAADKRTR